VTVLTCIYMYVRIYVCMYEFAIVFFKLTLTKNWCVCMYPYCSSRNCMYVCIRNGVGFFIRCNTDMAKAGDQCCIFCICIVYMCVGILGG
jgi:hypothetical protein